MLDLVSNILDVVLFLSRGKADDGKGSLRLLTINHNVALLKEYLEIPEAASADVPLVVAQHWKAGKRRQAIRKYREVTGLRRREAKKRLEATLAPLAWLERSVDQLLTAHNLSPADPFAPPGVVEHLDAGRKIQAIKAFRDVTGAGLKEAKDAVELLERRIRQGGVEAR